VIFKTRELSVSLAITQNYGDLLVFSNVTFYKLFSKTSRPSGEGGGKSSFLGVKRPGSVSPLSSAVVKNG
jgi:hypothetical protein